jgi:hypothetical protein
MKPWRPTEAFFQVPPPIPAGWGTFANPAPPQPEVLPAFHNDEAKKRAFGIELAKQADDIDGAFKAALIVFEDQIGPSLWAAHNWTNDPLVIASRDIYLKTLKLVEKPLDKTELAAKLLALADEKIERNGQKFHVHDAKDRIAALKAYAEVLGYTGKVNIDNSINNFNNNNRMELYLVKSDNQNEIKTIEASVEEDFVDLDNIVDLEIKLVS